MAKLVPFRIIDRLLNELNMSDVYKLNRYNDNNTDYYAQGLVKSTSLFFDPTPPEMNYAYKNNQIGAILTTHHLWIWDREYAEHDDTRRRFEKAQQLGIEALLGPKPEKDREVPRRRWNMALKTLNAVKMVEPKKPYKFVPEPDSFPLYLYYRATPELEPDIEEAQRWGWGTNPKPVLKFVYSSWSDEMRGGKAASRKQVTDVIAHHPYRKQYIFIDDTPRAEYGSHDDF